MKNFKWGTTSFYQDKEVHVVLFVSRNKDNKDIPDFKERRMSFITTEDKFSDSLYEQFINFVNGGVKDELSRMYYSVNSRDSQKIHKDFIHFLIDNPDFNLCYAAPKLAGIAAKKENALSKKWMFDFDSEDKDKLEEFRKDIYEAYKKSCDKIILEPKGIIKTYKTPHGYAVVVSNGFDTRELLTKWSDVNLKRDDLLCVYWKEKL